MTSRAVTVLLGNRYEGPWTGPALFIAALELVEQGAAMP